MAKPQLTLRRMLLITAVSALFFLAISLALRGHAWANTVAIVGTSLVVFFLAHALLYFLVLPFAHVSERRYLEKTKSPFADGSLPPEQTGLEDVVS